MLKQTKPGESRDQAIEFLLVDAQVALNFWLKRQRLGGKSAVKIQSTARMYMSRYRAQEVIFARWEKQWIAVNQNFVYADTWGLKAEKQHMELTKK